MVSLSSTAGACLSFLVSRYLAKPLVESKVAGALHVLTGAAVMTIVVVLYRH